MSDLPDASTPRRPTEPAHPPSPDLDVIPGTGVLARLTRLATQLLQVPVAAILLGDARGTRRRLVASAGLAGRADQDALAEVLCASGRVVLEQQAPLVAANSAGHPWAAPIADLAAGEGPAILVVPLPPVTGELLGALGVIADAPRTWTPEAIQQLEDLAWAAASEVELHRIRREQLQDGEDETRFAPVGRAAVDGQWNWDIARHTVFYSPRYRELLGYTAEEYPDTVDAFYGVLHPDDRPRLDAMVLAHLATGAAFDLEVRLRHADGSWRWFWNRGRAERDAAGQLIYMAGSISDVTDRHTAMAALRASEARYRVLLRHYPAGAVFLFDHELRVLVADGESLRAAGMDVSTLVGRTLAEALPPADVAELTPHYRLALAGGDARFTVHRNARVYEVQTAPVRDEGGEVVAAMAIARDVTEQVEAEAARESSEERFRTLVEHASDVVGIIAADGTIRYESPAIERVLGFRADELLGRDAFALIHPEDREMARARFTALVADPGGAMQITYRCQHRNGGWRELDAHVWNLNDHPGVRGAVVNARDVTERVEAERALRESESRLRLALDATGLAVWEEDLRPDARDEAAAGFQRWLATVHPEDRARTVQARTAGMRRGAFAVEYRALSELGEVRWYYTEARVLSNANGAPERLVGVCLDVTDRMALEAQLRQAQKMEAVGQLAGGVAHDFNNLLTVITGNLEFARGDLPPELSDTHPLRGDLDEIAHAAERARALVRQLLTFSRKQPVQPRDVRLGALMQSAEQLLRRVIGEEIVLEVDVADPQIAVHADPGQLEQVLMNLAVNARDAMLTPQHGHPGAGGTLEIIVDEVVLGASDAHRWGSIEPGRWVRLRVRDTGHGMDSATQAHAFEPFFTTKAVGVGTGLGLATVFGIVRQAGGAIRVDSAPGAGTTVTVLLPASNPDGVARTETPDAPGASGQGGTILLVEDEAAVRRTACRILERHGYQVLEARHGADAVLLWRAHRATIDLVVTDLRMPELGGRELLARLREEQPTLPAVFVSGYADRLHDVAPGAREVFLAKPFTAGALLAAVRQVLDAAPLNGAYPRG